MVFHFAGFTFLYAKQLKIIKFTKKQEGAPNGAPSKSLVSKVPAKSRILGV